MKILAFMLFLIAASFSGNFKKEQLKYDRVKTAYREKEELIKTVLQEKGVKVNSFELFIRVFKKEQSIEVWVKNVPDVQFKLLKEYEICSSSGTLGPKRKMGDLQTPEGFYYIDRFNPVSNFYLSLGINYPNTSDKVLGAKNPGGDIFIHGSCVTIGCLPITDEKIKELYLLAVEAKNNGQQKIPVHIFPSRLDEKGLMKLESQYKETNLLNFWKNLKEGYDFFENHRTIPKITVLDKGKYNIQAH